LYLLSDLYIGTVDAEDKQAITEKAKVITVMQQYKNAIQ